MGKQIEILVKENLSTLRLLKSKQSNLGKERRVYALICLKEGRFGLRQGLSNHLGISLRYLENWVVQYNPEGIDGFLSVKARREGSGIIGPEVHDGLAARFNDGSVPFRGYRDAQQWIKEEYGPEVKYHRVREYLIGHFGTKAKRPRKSHVKKDPRAIEAFLKLPHLVDIASQKPKEQGFEKVNLYFQDESRSESCIAAKGVVPVIDYRPPTCTAPIPRSMGTVLSGRWKGSPQRYSRHTYRDYHGTGPRSTKWWSLTMPGSIPQRTYRSRKTYS